MGTDEVGDCQSPAFYFEKKKCLKFHNLRCFFFHYFGCWIELWSNIVLMKKENDLRAHMQILFLPDSYQLYWFPWPDKANLVQDEAGLSPAI